MSSLMLSLSAADRRLLVAVLSRRRPRADMVMRLVTRVGNWYVILPFTIALATGVVPELRSAGKVALWALVVSHLAVQLMKRGVCRERPRLPAGFSRLVEPEDRFAFPSGHATAGLSVGLALFLALTGPAAVLALVLGLAIGVSRCYLGVHYPGDVLCGWALATVAVALAAAVGVR
jgi:undecaprenyl-diphosphatase